MDLDLVLDCVADKPVVIVRGDVDFGTASKLDKHLQDLAGEGHKEVHVDVTDVSYMDSEGLKVLIRLRNALGDDGQVTIRGAKGPVLRILEISGMPRIFDITD